MFGHQAEDRLPEGHICFLVDEIVDELELGPAARGNTVLGAPSYDPRMMVKVLFYGYNRGIRSSRKLAAEFAVRRMTRRWTQWNFSAEACSEGGR